MSKSKTIKLMNTEVGKLRAADEIARLIRAKKEGILLGLKIAEELVVSSWNQTAIEACSRLGVDPQEWHVDPNEGCVRRVTPAGHPSQPAHPAEDNLVDEAGPGEADPVDEPPTNGADLVEELETAQ